MHPLDAPERDHRGGRQAHNASAKRVVRFVGETLAKVQRDEAHKYTGKTFHPLEQLIHLAIREPQ